MTRGHGLDLSLGGVALRLAGGYSLGEAVVVDLELGAGTVRAEAEVVRGDDNRLGLRFTRLDPLTLRALTGAIARATPTPDPSSE